MCGINGFNFRDEGLVKQMNSLIRHRGPDSDGCFSDDDVSLGHQRLKIIDISEKGAQPMSDSEGKVWIVFNGEMYNFMDVRNELESRGYKFKSKCDTEVIIYAYKEWGVGCVNHFNGMWAFAIYDRPKKKMFLSRDRLGKKPLYYHVKDGRFIFSSEIKPLFIDGHGIEKKLNKKAASSYLSYRFVLGEETMFDGIRKLLPGHSMLFDMDKGQVERVWQYWDVGGSGEIKDDKDEARAKGKVESLLKDAVSVRQVSDVPIGSINSGGLDSSVISAMMATIQDSPIRTYTVKLPEKGHDETPFAKLLADRYKTIHREIVVDVSNFLDLMKEYAAKKDEPVGVPNEIALYLLFKEIKKSATVILSGEGADEIFAGYNRIFRSPYDYERLKRLEKGELKDYKGKYSSLYRKYGGRFFKDEVEHFMFLYNYFPDKEKNFILKDEAHANFEHFFREYFSRVKGPYSKKISYAFLKVNLSALLAKLDNSSMASAVEARCPFLDYRLVNLVFNLPFSLKNPLKPGIGPDGPEIGHKNCDEIADEYDIPKYILKKVGEEYLPNEIVARKKMGFPMPLEKWFREDLYPEAKKLLLSKDSKIGMVANKDNILSWMEDNVNNTGNTNNANNANNTNTSQGFGLKLWMLLSLELWLREWF